MRWSTRCGRVRAAGRPARRASRWMWPAKFPQSVAMLTPWPAPGLRPSRGACPRRARSRRRGRPCRRLRRSEVRTRPALGACSTHALSLVNVGAASLPDWFLNGRVRYASTGLRPRSRPPSRPKILRILINPGEPVPPAKDGRGLSGASAAILSDVEGGFAEEV
jgi:hypothetical protein